MTQRQQEIIILAGMYAKGLRWLAGIGDNKGIIRNLCGYRDKPHKESYLGLDGTKEIYWETPNSCRGFMTSFDQLADHIFPEIRATDEEPTNIGELFSKKILEELGSIDSSGNKIKNLFQSQFLP